MIREIFKCQVGILFHAPGLEGIGLNPETIYPVVLPRPAPLFAQGLTVEPRPKSKPWWKLFHISPQQQDEVHHHDLHEGNEEDEELRDALSPIYDQLTVSKGWWVLEFWPIKTKFQTGDKWTTEYGINLGSARHIPKQRTNGVKVHRSVKLRMDAGYKPAAKWDVEPIWVD